eukprot:COSAG02_NODE_1647_length_11517_cov_2.751533_4_plen_99_part_00
MIGEALEVLQRKALQILFGNAHDPKPCNCIQQQGGLVGTQLRACQIDTGQPASSATRGKWRAEPRPQAEQLLQLEPIFVWPFVAVSALNQRKPPQTAP